MNGLAKVSESREYINGKDLNVYNQNIEQYITNLPANIKKLNQIKKELKQLIIEADNRAPSFFKTGNLKDSIKSCVNIDDVNKLLEFAETTLNSIALNQNTFRTTQNL